MKKLKNTKTNIKNNDYTNEENQEMDDLHFDEMNDVWDELDDLDI